jgi:hypothetical protein
MITRSGEVCDMRQDDALLAVQRLAENSLAILDEWPGSFHQDLIRPQQIRALLHRIQVIAFISAFNEDTQDHILLAEQVPQALLSRSLVEPRHERLGTPGRIGTFSTETSPRLARSMIRDPVLIPPEC